MFFFHITLLKKPTTYLRSSMFNAILIWIFLLCQVKWQLTWPARDPRMQTVCQNHRESHRI
ncbi:hypothetical protein CPB83DRAFT_856682 [Crepidotus variabilis]|uniref:Uncharacterized protein n=1 Tax=Crepidotus variabilis TaxID=179855 RepID=A0A9P6JNE8_9AGAR|nr:hypothetical protein CPB83DRAFT_856682 [Crepidotus variabilis]